MKIEDIIALAGAGFSKEDIVKIAGTVSAPAPAPASAPASAPVQVQNNTQDMFNQRMGILDNRLDEITKLIQVGNLSNSQIPEPPTTGDMLASIINPPVKE
ncbi:MAG: hypothetical protein [Bacteriophage sp.]|nr:MAG: hypothetical protein [Bacteriophage sp.]